MQTEIILAGFGGQGILFAGQLLAYAAMDEGYEVTWIPSYGPEMRGGTANCTVIIADEEIGSATVRNPKAALIFNLPSFDKYEPLVVPGGILIANASLINRDFQRMDLDGVTVPANEIAEELGEKRLLNMVMLGCLVEKMPLITHEMLAQALDKHMPERHKHLYGLNIQALLAGQKYAQEARAQIPSSN